MHPHLDSVLRDSPGVGSQADDGVSYRRRLKVETDDTDGGSADAEASAGQGVSQGSANKRGPVMQERRRSPRFSCPGSIELFAEGSRVPMRGLLRDISLHGCYAEMSNTLPVDTKVALVVDALGLRVRTLARVRACYPFLGMGICFAEMEPPEQEHLKQILAALAGRRAAARGLSRPTGAAEGPTVREPRA